MVTFHVMAPENARTKLSSNVTTRVLFVENFLRNPKKGVVLADKYPKLKRGATFMVNIGRFENEPISSYFL